MEKLIIDNYINQIKDNLLDKNIKDIKNINHTNNQNLIKI